MKAHGLFCFLVMGAALLTGCQPAAAAQDAADSPTAAAPGVGQSEPVGGVVIHPDPPRSSMFNIHTLAYTLPGIEDVAVDNITYAHHNEVPLTFDFYYPPGADPGTPLPVVLFGMGYPMSKQPLRNAHFYTSWGKLVAAAGMGAVVYDAEEPEQDLALLVDFLRRNAAELGIDPDKLGFMASSANAPTVMAYLMQPGRTGFQFSIYYYALSLTPDRKYTEELAEGCASQGCVVSSLSDVTTVDPDIPLLVVLAGQDVLPNINTAMHHFIRFAEGEGAQVTLLEYADGRHGFDSEQRTPEAAEIISETLAFMRTHFGLDGK